MEDNITEKFALLNLIKALQGISAPDTVNAEKNSTPPPSPSAPAAAPQVGGYNAMASVLQRHEAISNRVRNKK